MPPKPLRLRKMPGYPCLDVLFPVSSVDVVPGRKLESAQFANGENHLLCHQDMELVRSYLAVSRHNLSFQNNRTIVAIIPVHYSKSWLSRDLPSHSEEHAAMAVDGINEDKNEILIVSRRGSVPLLLNVTIFLDFYPAP
jgi:hypothetical protein